MALPENTSVFRGTLDFFFTLGIYDVVLPFLLVFTLVFAILEKTKAFGTEKFGDKEFTRRNLNAMMAFVSAFFVVASTQLVAMVNVIVAHTVLLLLISICFMMLAGSFQTGSKEFFLEGTWKNIFMIIMFIGIIIIFLNATGWLDIIWEALFYRFDSTMVSSLVLIIGIIVFMVYITKDPKPKEKPGDGK